ncbi:MAG TPA: TIR domain-containing protein [Solirubrobacterales bacterium]|nr:TIR domain-containing protein [Solirubrobacterales bacterium]
MAEDVVYDVCLSFPGEHRDYVRSVYEALALRGIECFFDEPHQVELWGQDLAERFDRVFRKEAQFCVAFVSEEWVKRTWPAHERRSAVARMLQEPGYLLPVRFDDTEVPGMSPTIGYLDGTILKPHELAELIVKKVKRRPRYNFLPLNPNRMFAALGIRPDDEDGQVKAASQAEAFLTALGNLDSDTREMAVFILGFGCTCRLPESIHMPMDRIATVMDLSVDRTKRALRGIRRAPEFSIVGLVDEDEDPEGGFDLCLSWEPRTPKAPPGDATHVASAMIREAGYQACESCHIGALERLDFSRTSSMLDWNGDEFEVLDENAAPPALRELIGYLLDAGWTYELTFDQLRFLEPDGLFFEVVPLEDRHDPESIKQAREPIEDLVYGTVDENKAV